MVQIDYIALGIVYAQVMGDELAEPVRHNHNIWKISIPTKVKTQVQNK